MTQLAHKMTAQTFAARTESIMEGAGTQLFTSGSAPTGTDMLSGDAVEMFTTSCIDAGQTRDAGAGEGVEMFTTSCVEVASDTTDGDNVALFTTSC